MKNHLKIQIGRDRRMPVLVDKAIKFARLCISKHIDRNFRPDATPMDTLLKGVIKTPE